MHRLLLAALLLLAAVPAPSLAQDGPVYRPPQPPRGGSVAVYRGGARQESASPVKVYRGSALPPARRVDVGTAPARGIVPVAGSRLWLVDGEADRLVACRLARTGLAGGRRTIRCSDAALGLH